MLDPAAGYIQALANAKKDPHKGLESECPLERLLSKEILGHPVVTNALHRAYDIYRSSRNSKIVMESLLFCMEPLETLTSKIAKHMNIAESVPIYYATYFFDPGVFEDMFDRLDYIEFLSEKHDPYAVKDKVTKQLAMTEGFYYIISHFKGGIIEYTASEYMKRLLAIANKYVAQAQNTGILSKESDKLYKWIQLASKLSLSAQSLQNNSVDDALQDIKIALEYDDRPARIEVLPPEDVLRG